ncbi:hypothetical protein COU15_01765 [Candidatus Kaiserbacteria bacterium CG10_big_fil_rev_8_21_14_0_10_45_20]|uniref:Type II secretion system protein GspG C-terminal domain-containing protein n=1 Tax=Candidatus Kaiserbacteria bacterium CG10_big_fil_rev_8_21_14_0_10_45_20 TaxID=1974607 RepID=A0A2H0UFS7_9BACT|nr:MAG: hypothetical protein COU15_01765 [Candidatus Kaiserbacteria bacterium CG10_big_fil_rev_8_21_14_0_10_45_20]
MYKQKRGFTLIELLVVIAIIGVLSSVVLASLSSARTKARDAKRLSDMQQMRTALELYHISFSMYPASGGGPCGGWDSPGDGTFTTPLVENDFIPDHLSDPTVNDNCGNYAYYRYNAGSYGCDASKGPFFVLGIRDLETSSRPHSASPGWSCPSRNWQNEFDWVIGGFQ